MNKKADKLKMFMLWAVFPPAFIYLILKKDKGIKREKMTIYMSVIFSPFTWFVIGSIIFYMTMYRTPLSKVENTLGIKVPFWHLTLKNITSWLDMQDYTSIVVIKFNDNSLRQLKDEIERTQFYNQYYYMLNTDGNRREKMDSNVYYKTYNYLSAKKLTGYWYKKDSKTYVFFEPNYGESHILNYSYSVFASLSLKDKKLRYRFVKI